MFLTILLILSFQILAPFQAWTFAKSLQNLVLTVHHLLPICCEVEGYFFPISYLVICIIFICHFEGLLLDEFIGQVTSKVAMIKCQGRVTAKIPSGTQSF